MHDDSSAADDLDARVDAAELGQPADRAALVREIEARLSTLTLSEVDRVAHLLGLKARLQVADRVA
jgi:hypothetical protein